jgi:hypothetical protein
MTKTSHVKQAGVVMAESSRVNRFSRVLSRGTGGLGGQLKKGRRTTQGSQLLGGAQQHRRKFFHPHRVESNRWSGDGHDPESGLA